jgi:hypothetical protein
VPQRPVPPPLAPDPAALAELQEQMAWLAMLIIFMLILAVGVALMVAARMLLSNWIGAPLAPMEGRGPELTVEPSGTPRGDAKAVLRWLLSWLRERLARSGRTGGTRAVAPRAGVSDASAANAWAVYRRLLAWAEGQGLGRRPAETTRQLQSRLARYKPDAADTVDLVTDAYEWERYGDVRPAPDRLRRIGQALAALLDR